MNWSNIFFGKFFKVESPNLRANRFMGKCSPKDRPNVFFQPVCERWLFLSKVGYIFLCYQLLVLVRIFWLPGTKSYLNSFKFKKKKKRLFFVRTQQHHQQVTALPYRKPKSLIPTPCSYFNHWSPSGDQEGSLLLSTHQLLSFLLLYWQLLHLEEKSSSLLSISFQRKHTCYENFN